MEIQPGRPAAGRGGDAGQPKAAHFNSQDFGNEDFFCIQGTNAFVYKM